MPTTFKPDNDQSAFVDSVDRHFYENQVPSSSPFKDTSFQQAAAHAKDKARHKLIKRIREEERKLTAETFSGIGDFSEEARRNVLANRKVDGVEGAPDNTITL